MSIRQLLHEIKPLFRMLEEPLTRPFPAFGSSLRNVDPFDFVNRPAVDVTEEHNKYILDADLPGVKKENLKVIIGNDGRSVTIDGRSIEKSGTSGTPDESNSLSVAKSEEGSTQISAERPFTRNVKFLRTVWLPHPVDPKHVSAKLEDGVLRVTIDKAEDARSTVIQVE